MTTENTAIPALIDRLWELQRATRRAATDAADLREQADNHESHSRKYAQEADDLTAILLASGVPSSDLVPVPA
jgi:hypothetical protein